MFTKLGPKHAFKDEIELAVFEILGKFRLGVRDLGLLLAVLGSMLRLVVPSFVHSVGSGWGGLWREIDDGGRSVIGAACGGRRWELGGERVKCLGGARRAASDAGLFIGAGRRWRGREPRTWSSCLPVNGGSGSSAGGIRDEESTRRDDGAIGQDPMGSDAMESARGSDRREVAGGLRQRHTGGRRWRACAALSVERVTAQATRPWPGRHARPGAACTLMGWHEELGGMLLLARALALCCWQGSLACYCCLWSVLLCVSFAGVSAWRGKGFVLQACMHTGWRGVRGMRACLLLLHLCVSNLYVLTYGVRCVRA
jgi:hypothetical protein